MTEFSGTFTLQSGDVQTDDVIALKVTSLTDLAGNVVSNPLNGSSSSSSTTRPRQAGPSPRFILTGTTELSTFGGNNIVGTDLNFNFKLVMPEECSLPAFTLTKSDSTNLIDRLSEVSTSDNHDLHGYNHSRGGRPRR